MVHMKKYCVVHCCMYRLWYILYVITRCDNHDMVRHLWHKFVRYVYGTNVGEGPRYDNGGIKV